jgi:hypothetical protein
MRRLSAFGHLQETAVVGGFFIGGKWSDFINQKSIALMIYYGYNDK